VVVAETTSPACSTFDTGETIPSGALGKILSLAQVIKTLNCRPAMEKTETSDPVVLK
jgi:hypothetical protein